MGINLPVMDRDKRYALSVPSAGHVARRRVTHHRTIDQRVGADYPRGSLVRHILYGDSHVYSQHWTPNSRPANVKFCDVQEATQDSTVSPWSSGFWFAIIRPLALSLVPISPCSLPYEKRSCSHIASGVCPVAGEAGGNGVDENWSSTASTSAADRNTRGTGDSACEVVDL